MQKSLSVFICIFLPFLIFSQSDADKLKIYIDCQMRCDFTYIKEEIRFVNYMQDRYESDVYILATRQRTGAGGREVQLSFSGNNGFSGINDTLTYITDPDATDAIVRELLVANLKKGLLPYLIESPLFDNINYEIISNGESVEETGEEQITDPWNYWVFSIGGSASFDGEESFSSTDLTGRFFASRVTDKSKFYISSRYNYEREKFILSDGEEFISIKRSYSNYLTYVKSVSDHWSAGLRAGVGSSTFGNTDFEASLKPAVEYNVFPYSESSTRRFSFLYSIGPEYNNYTDTTVFDKLEETVFRHGLDIEFEQTQKWGSLSIEMGLEQYLHDMKLYSMYINPDLEWSVFKGFSIDFGGYIAFVRDRINIAKADLDDEDILLQTKQLDTDYSFFTYIGINYRFGSKYNNFVNSRF